MTSVASRRKYGKNRLLRGLRKNRTKNSNGLFISPSWYPEVPNLDPQDIITTPKIDLKARDVTRGKAGIVRALGDDVYTADFCRYTHGP
jgi:hypothetical protein